MGASYSSVGVGAAFGERIGERAWGANP